MPGRTRMRPGREFTWIGGTKVPSARWHRLKGIWPGWNLIFIQSAVRRRRLEMTRPFDAACDFGVTRLLDGSVRFRLWAPAQETVGVAIEDGEVLPMQRSTDGWFEATGVVADGTLYRYRLADGTMGPDPAPRRQAGDVHGPSVVYTAPFDWTCADWQGRPW